MPATRASSVPQKFYLTLGHRASRTDTRAMKAEIGAMTRDQRTFDAIQDLALKLKVNGQIAWKYAKGLGAPPRNGRRAHKLLSHQMVLDAEARMIAGEQLTEVALSLGTYPSTLRNRLDRLDEEREEHAEAEAQAKAKVPFSGPRIYQSEFIRPLTLKALCGSRHPTGPTESNIQNL